MSSANGEGEQYGCPWEGCGYTSDTQRGVSIHHSQAHGESIPDPTAICEWCEDEFEHRRGETYNPRFCSYDCHNAWQASGAMDGEDHPSWGGRKTIVCEQCEEKFQIEPYRVDRARFCSKECLWQWRRENEGGESHHFWEGGEAAVVCEQCGDEFNVRQHRVGRARFCSEQCLSEWKSEAFAGSNSAVWRGGVNLYRVLRSLLPRPWREAKRETHIRDGGRCQNCGVHYEENGSKHHKHHIVPVLSGGTNGDYNLISLCPSCHKKADNYTEDLFNAPFTETGA